MKERKVVFSQGVGLPFHYTVAIERNEGNAARAIVVNGTVLDSPVFDGARGAALRMRATADAIDKAAGVLESEGRLVPLQK